MYTNDEKQDNSNENNDGFGNSWACNTRAESYAKLELPNDYYLAYRDLPEIISKHIKGKNAIDFGCGTGRSTRLLKSLGFNTTGIDISKDMLEQAAKLDPKGIYHLVENGAYSHLGIGKYDLIQAVFTFDNISGWDKRTYILTSLRQLLNSSGRIIMLDSTPQLYKNEWASFSTKDFPENQTAKTGDVVKVIMLDVEDKTPVDDIYWTEEDYHKLFFLADLEVEATYKPLGYEDEPYEWVNEKEIAPWMIFVLKKKPLII